MDESHWLRRLRLIARFGDRQLRKIREEAAEREMRNLPSTIFDEIGDAISNDSRLSKIKRRVGPENMSALLGIVVGSVTDGFNANVDSGDEKILEAGFDISQARTDQILGHKLAMKDALPAFFALISMLVDKFALSDICKFPKSDLESARNDVRSAINTVITLYEATSPIYGPTALGLRQAAWVARKSSPNTKAFYVLVFAALRRYPNFLLDRQRISDLENTAGISLKNLKALQKLQQTPQFKESLSNKSLRRGFGSHDALWQLLREIEAARLKK